MASENMRDAAFPQNLEGYKGIVGGYYGGPHAFRVWLPSEWAMFKKNKKLPIWVGGYEGAEEGHQAVAALTALGVPKGSYTVLDLETRIDKTFVEHFGEVLHHHGYRVFPYGSASTIFSNPKLNGYWVADYANKGPFYYPGARMTQYASNQQFDSSTVKFWTRTLGSFWK